MRERDLRERERERDENIYHPFTPLNALVALFFFSLMFFFLTLSKVGYGPWVLGPGSLVPGSWSLVPGLLINGSFLLSSSEGMNRMAGDIRVSLQITHTTETPALPIINPQP